MQSGGGPKGQRAPGSDYDIVQVYVAFAEQPQNPVILRADEQYTVADILSEALTKYMEDLTQVTGEGGAASSPFAPPSTDPDDYILRVARGDGAPNPTASPLVPTATVRQQQLAWPYMLVLTLDPAKEATQMQLTPQFKARLYQRAPPPESPTPGYTDPFRPPSRTGAGPPAVSTPPVVGSRLGGMEADATGSSVPRTLSQIERDRMTRDNYHEDALRREEVGRRRAENVDRIQRETQEKERLQLEQCAKRERERLAKEAIQRQQEQTQQLKQMEDRHRTEMAHKLEVSLKEKKQRELLEEQKRQLEREERERQRRYEALERERQKRLQDKQESRKKDEDEKRMAREAGKEKRINYSLQHVIEQLHDDIDSDNRAREVMLHSERLESEAWQREMFERQSTAKVERQRAIEKEKENRRRAERELRQNERKAEIEAKKLAQAQQEEEELAAKKQQWLVQRRAQQLKNQAMKELHDISRSEAADSGDDDDSDSN